MTDVSTETDLIDQIEDSGWTIITIFRRVPLSKAAARDQPSRYRGRPWVVRAHKDNEWNVFAEAEAPTVLEALTALAHEVERRRGS